MYIKKIIIQNFRNYRYQELELKQGVNILYGDNAQGKTNLIEAIYLCALGKSFRTKKEKELIQLEKKDSKIEIFYQKSDREGKIQVQIGDTKSYAINGIKIKKLSELLRKSIYCVISSR